MKRIGNLFDKIVDMDNLILADQKARRGKSNRYGVKVHDEHCMEDLIKLQDALIHETYEVSKYKHFTLYEPKERYIWSLPFYPDRIVQHAIMNVLEPIWTKTFTHNTFACLKGRGIHGCLRAVRKIMRCFMGKTLYCLKIDIRKFYASIKHRVLKAILRKKLKDAKLLRLLFKIIDSVKEWVGEVGIPIGNYLSQFFANLVLAYFMHWINEELKVKATQYADDICFFSSSKEELHNVLEKVTKYINEKLELDLKGNFQIFPISFNIKDKAGRALDYVGYKIFRGQILARKSIKQNYCRKMVILNKVTTTIKEYKQAVSAWYGWFKYCNGNNLLRKTIKIEYYDSLFNRQARCA